MYYNFERDIEEMNMRYKLGAVNTQSWDAMTKRLAQFKDILGKEFNELGDIQIELDLAMDSDGQERLLQARVALADLLADIIVYCSSEAQRWMLNLDAIGQIVMASNTSKLGADGKPIINPENGKFEKGPNYWKPEHAIRHGLQYGFNNVIFHRDDNGVYTVELVVPVVE